MNLAAFDFDLPEKLIALRPADPQDSARLLVVHGDGRLEDATVRDLPRYLLPGDVLVFNDTRVLPAALKGIRPARDAAGADVACDVNLVERINDNIWRALARPGKRLKPGDVIRHPRSCPARQTRRNARPQPLEEAQLEANRLHAEWRRLTPETADRLNMARAAGHRCVPVGTTAMRTLESCTTDAGTLAPATGPTDIFLKPGDAVRATDALVTNFHLPASSLFMLVCALMGTDVMQAAYAHAIASGYRFYSYGDACLLLP